MQQFFPQVAAARDEKPQVSSWGKDVWMDDEPKNTSVLGLVALVNSTWGKSTDIMLKIKALFIYLFLSLQSQIIKSMLSLKPEERPEAGKLKKDIEECTHTFTTPKNMPNKSNSV